MDFELRRAREKLEREQKERKEKARLKLERDRKSKQEAARQRDAIEAVQRSRRLDAAEAQLKCIEVPLNGKLAVILAKFDQIISTFFWKSIVFVGRIKREAVKYESNES
ncbi:hypothetical protein CK203_026310 [Vitis vinifera]|uniref:Uncharacterized protein n=1 Tax=Vitis vinifera TaxID=29760 RepID=A0A438IKW5_VITVI|nr:hypothetical protein CK203_026310 [Vitis vinifera]